GLEKVARLVFRAAQRLETRQAPLTFVRTVSPGGSGRQAGGGYSAYFGSIPDFTESDKPGVRPAPFAISRTCRWRCARLAPATAWILSTCATARSTAVVRHFKNASKYVSRAFLWIVFAALCACAGAPAAKSNIEPVSDERHLANVKQLTFGGQNAEAYFSADGARLIFQSTRPPHVCDQIFTMDIDGKNVRLLSSGQG